MSLFIHIFKNQCSSADSMQGQGIIAPMQCMDLCVFHYETNDHGFIDGFGILMMITLMFAEVSGDIFPTL